MLKILPGLVYPITTSQFDRLMDSVVQLNLLDAGLTEPQQRALGIYLHTFDLYAKSRGRINYIGTAGHQRLVQDAMTFCGVGNPVATRNGDLPAAHLALDYSDTAVRIKEAEMQSITNDVHQLVYESRDLAGLSVVDEKRIGLLMDMLGKKPIRQ